MKNKQSTKHHYLPRKYLKGFADEQNGFWVYDKKQDNYFKSSPDNSFFQNHLNTLELPNGETSDILEDLYADMENVYWKFHDKIANSNPNTQFEFTDLLHLFRFLLYLHWRLPSNIKYAENISESALFRNGDIDYFKLKSKDGKDVPDEIIEKMRSSSVFKKYTRQIAAFAPFFKNPNLGRELEKWCFLYTQGNPGSYIVGDNPIITEGIYDHDPVNCLKEFVFPVSGKVLLVNTEKRITTDFPLKFTIYYSIAMIERSERFIACHSEAFLKDMVKIYRDNVKHGMADKIIPELFGIIRKAQSSHAD
jgi:hypothetical protein